ncbi:hypothetical protein [uncultured Rhodoblastus sp.]|uniref:hypothetical protein n=1 Tax=uncultured Rhodoblastus sp. TaxID=543037 RepID=UPI0025DEB9B0|nr:hypothetical protein [uncultured Rhodoblastus sp.]
MAWLILASGFPVATLAAGKAHDGHWQVQLQTAVGACAASAETVVAIKQGRVVSISAAGVTPWGYVDENNTFVGHFSNGQRVMRAHGDVRGSSAHGPWSSQTDYCGGTWAARKID